jgi:hypothetical protein
MAGGAAKETTVGAGVTDLEELTAEGEASVSGV